MKFRTNIWGSVRGPAEVELHLGDVRVDADRTRVGIKRIAELVDLEVEHANGAPEG